MLNNKNRNNNSNYYCYFCEFKCKFLTHVCKLRKVSIVNIYILYTEDVNTHEHIICPYIQSVSYSVKSVINNLMNEAESLMKNYGDRGGCYG